MVRRFRPRLAALLPLIVLAAALAAFGCGAREPAPDDPPLPIEIHEEHPVDTPRGGEARLDAAPEDAEQGAAEPQQR
jgi:hypothetical protein